MDSNTFTALVAIASALLGGLFAWVSQYYSSKKEDERRFEHDEQKKRELDFKRKVTAYRRLKSLTDRVMWKPWSPTGGPPRIVSKDELEGIESTLAQN